MIIKYDNEISVSIGKSRKEIRWKNRDLMWSLFVQKLSGTHVTAETLTEYLKADKSRQAEIKDVGGFVGGVLSEGRRKADSVLSRSLVTLDVDNASLDFWDNFTMYYDNAAVVYSTHKHSPDKPRLRLIVPLSRMVTPAEYVPIARRIAGNLGIEQFDDTTYEPERLMYWPSTPKDIEYYFRYQDGPFINADEILSTYHDWTDAAEWPVSDREGEAIRREIKKQADPLEKTGIVGAFCRTYDIHKAIETFLADVYEPCDQDNRYTYKNGSTAAGLIVYDDKFAYSHHGTDPVGGMLCNAFDLVRAHKFGHLDENVKRDGTRADRYPSFSAMEDFCTCDKAVKRLLMSERNKSAVDDFEEVETEEDETWMDELGCDKKGNCLSTRENISIIMRHDKKIGCVATDKFSNRRSFKDSLPAWRQRNDTDMSFRDDDEENLRLYLESKYGIDSKGKISDVTGTVARINAFHPVQDYLIGLRWDGIKRVETFFVDYLGVEDCELFRECSKIALAAGVARILEPGKEYDNVIILVGKQGVGKSKLLAKLAKDRRWFTDSFTIEGKEAYENLRGKWIIEIAELAALKKADMEAVKKFLTSTSDFYRAAYERYPQEQPRQCIFFGTTNDLNFLRDSTGDRRFWPMEVSAERKRKDMWKDLTCPEINQIWAEAKYLYENGQRLYLSPEMEKEMDVKRGIYTVSDDRVGLIAQYLDTLLPVGWDGWDIDRRTRYLRDPDPLNEIGTIRRDCVCVAEIWCECLGGRRSDLTRSVSKEIMALMRQVDGWGWSVRAGRFPIYNVQKYFYRINRSEQIGAEPVSR